jgi:energy-converting hydrogenase Eha subunit B
MLDAVLPEPTASSLLAVGYWLLAVGCWHGLFAKCLSFLTSRKIVDPGVAFLCQVLNTQS